nr:AMP-binding protein [Polyangiaceae bacterium]
MEDSTSAPLLDHWTQHWSPSHVAVTSPAGTHTYADLRRAAFGVASAIAAASKGAPSEHRVAIFVEPGFDFVAALFGSFFSGVPAIVISGLHPTKERQFYLEDAGVHVVIASNQTKEAAREFIGERALLVVDASPAELSPTGDATGSGTMAHVELFRRPALQLYTSGTTGKPKGAVLSHGNLLTQAGLLRDAWGITPRDTLLHALPLHHMHGLVIALVTAITAGACVKFLSNDGTTTKFDAALAWEEMARATTWMAVPTMYQRLFATWDTANDEERDRWSRHAKALRLATSGSAALPVSLGNRWKDLTGHYPLERFGMTEIGVGCTNPLVSTEINARTPGAVGHPLPTVETKIVDEEGNNAEIGELWIAGPSVFLGYFHRDDANAESFVAENNVRWFRTGDTVTKLMGGAIKILGRTSVDIIKSGGYKISAIEIEEALRRLPSVADAAVLGFPDENWGEKVVAFV